MAGDGLDPLAPLSAIAAALEGAHDAVRELLGRLDAETPAWAYAVELVGAINVVQTHLQARVVPAVAALEPAAPRRGTSGNPRANPCSHGLTYGCPLCDVDPGLN